jgi:erythromycin esterase
LEFLKPIIGESKVVLLGEQSHGEGAVFEAKTRLIMFLHQEMGYEILAFESGMFECLMLTDSLKVFTGEEDPLLTAQKAVFGTWTRSQELRDLFQYIIENSNSSAPLLVRGVDSQFTGEYSENHYVQELNRICDENAVQYTNSTDGILFESVLNRLTYDFDYKPSMDTVARFFSVLDHLEKQLSKKESAFGEKDRTILQALRGAGILAQDQFHERSDNLRDRQMAENLKLLCELHPEKKIIVWAASFHILADNMAVLDEDYENYQPMGTVFRSLSDARTTSVAFISYGGETYHPIEKSAIQLDTPPSNSLEQMAHDYGQPYSVINLQEWKDKDTPISSRPLGHWDVDAYWWRGFDLMFYIEECTSKTVIYERKQR